MLAKELERERLDKKEAACGQQREVGELEEKLRAKAKEATDMTKHCLHIKKVRREI